jgi:MurNAc alpha-1-phosphate uridylyltransferase
MTIGNAAMVLAAGFGTRMRPLTNTMPKPLVKVAGKSLLDYGFDHLREADVATAVVNGHYLADQIEGWVQTVSAPHTIFSSERDAILDTGGGIARALPLLGAEAFFVLNADCFWLDGPTPALTRLRAAWDDATMDCLLLLCDPAHTTGYDGKGDFAMDAQGRLARRNTAPDAKALAYIGGYLVHPRLFAAAPPGAFSMNLLWDRAIAQGRLFGLAHDGHWLHVGTVDAIAEAEDFLRRRK